MADGRYRIDPNRNDPWIQLDGISLDVNNYDAVEINMASNAPDGNAAIYFTTKDSPDYGENKRIEFYVINAGINIGTWKTYTVYMKNHPLWKGTITGLRIDPATLGKEGTDNSDTIGFDWIKVIKADRKPSIVSAAPDYSIYRQGNIITFSYWISNPFANDISDTLLYAAVRPSGTGGSWIEDSYWLNDKIVTLGSASNYEVLRYNRNFRLPSPASTGYYDVYVSISHQTTRDLYDSEYLTSSFRISSSQPVIIDPTPTPTMPPPDPTSTPLPSPTATPTPVPPPICDRCDINQDGEVNIFDLVSASRYFGETTISPYPRYDVNQDNTVDILDLCLIAQNIT